MAQPHNPNDGEQHADTADAGAFPTSGTVDLDVPQDSSERDGTSLVLSNDDRHPNDSVVPHNDVPTRGTVDLDVPQDSSEGDGTSVASNDDRHPNDSVVPHNDGKQHAAVAGAFPTRGTVDPDGSHASSEGYVTWSVTLPPQDNANPIPSGGPTFKDKVSSEAHTCSY